ncbi:UDP-glucose/GDP-mannose dehydrogenase family protein, partial [Candidatus Dojkabacteria bacterium]|nr:UDP-glucose/GDP-mannose dehydrogenase family protein [Candidatus Dojkabacteria bacterium]
METKPIISIVGTGYVGLTSAAVLANAGFKVFAVDIDPKKIDIIKSGKSHFFEGGLDEFVSKAVETGNLLPTISFKESIPESNIVFSCVGTPDNPDGSPNLEYIYSAAESIAKNAKDGIVVVQKSTVPVGTGRKLMAHIAKVSPDLKFSYVSNPEFLREGSALFDTLNMDRVVVGSDDKEALEKVVSVFTAVNDFAQDIDYSEFSDYRLNNVSKITPFSKTPFSERVFKMGLESAELVKVSANAFLALKISFANS